MRRRPVRRSRSCVNGDPRQVKSLSENEKHRGVRKGAAFSELNIWKKKKQLRKGKTKEEQASCDCERTRAGGAYPWAGPGLSNECCRWPMGRSATAPAVRDPGAGPSVRAQRRSGVRSRFCESCPGGSGMRYVLHSFHRDPICSMLASLLVWVPRKARNTE